MFPKNATLCMFTRAQLTFDARRIESGCPFFPIFLIRPGTRCTRPEVVLSVGLARFSFICLCRSHNVAIRRQAPFTCPLQSPTCHSRISCFACSQIFVASTAARLKKFVCYKQTGRHVAEQFSSRLSVTYFYIFWQPYRLKSRENRLQQKKRQLGGLSTELDDIRPHGQCCFPVSRSLWPDSSENNKYPLQLPPSHTQKHTYTHTYTLTRCLDEEAARTADMMPLRNKIRTQQQSIGQEIAAPRRLGPQ